MTYEEKYLINLLSSALNEKPISVPSEKINWEKIYSIAIKHQVANTAYYSIKSLPEKYKPEQTILKKFELALKQVSAREAIQHFEVENILNIFEKNKIRCLPLKGWLVKYLYPNPDMRSMCDIDILFDDKDTREIRKIMSSLDYSLEFELHDNVHDMYMKPPYMTIELHRRLFSKEQFDLFNYFSKVFDRASKFKNYNYIYKINKEDFYIHLLAHAKKHYENGGTGIRTIMDIYIFKKNQLNKKEINIKLKNLKLLKFSENIETLSEIWFANKQTNPFYEKMGSYILNSGVYGTLDNKINHFIANNSKTSNLLGKIKYFFNRMFLKKSSMIKRYPKLSEYPFLLPYYWILRLLDSMFFRRKTVKSELKTLKSINKQDISNAKNLYSDIM